MLHNAASRWIVGTLVFVALLGVLRFKPWRGFVGAGDVAATRQELRVGFLPVT